MLPTDRPNLPQPTDFGTTSEQFARALRNSALFDLNVELHTEPRGGVIPGAVILDGWLAALERCVSDLTRADRFAPDEPADPALIERLTERLVR